MNPKGWWKSQAGIKTVNKVLVAAMGLFMIGMAIAGTIMTLEEPLIGVDWGYILMPAYAYSGVVILLSLDKPLRFAVFMAGVTFGTMNMFQQLVILTQIGTAPSAVLAVIMDLAMIISSILCLMGDRYGSLRLLGICLISFSTTFSAQMMDVLGLTDYTLGYTTFWWMIVECVFLVVFMIVLLRPGMREESVKSRMRKGVIVVGSKLVSDPLVSIRAKDVNALTGSDTSGWTVNDDGDPIESEYTAEVRDGKKIVYLTSCRWRGDDEIRVSIAPDIKYRLYGSGFVLRGHSIEESGGSKYLRLYGDDGFFLRILIEEGDLSRPTEDDDEYFEPVEYVGDKITTG